MHELGLLSAMVKTIEGIAQEEGLERVEKIVRASPGATSAAGNSTRWRRI